jgi:hypothetical protein
MDDRSTAPPTSGAASAPPRRTFLRGLSLAALAAGLGIAATLVLVKKPSRPAAAPAAQPWSLQVMATLPPPSAPLLEAQARAAGGETAALAQVDEHMRAYRLGMKGVPATVVARHAEADRLIDAGQAVEAGRVLASIIETAPTAAPGTTAAEHRRILIQDAYFRLCRLAYEAGQPVVTALQVDNALALGDPDDLFVTNLLALRSAAHTLLGNGPLAAADRERASRLNQTLAVSSTSR